MTKPTPAMAAAREQIIQTQGVNAPQLTAFDDLVKQSQFNTDLVLKIFNKPARGMYLSARHLEELDDLFMNIVASTIDRCHQMTMLMLAKKTAEQAVMQKRIDELEAHIGIVKKPEETMN